MMRVHRDMLCDVWTFAGEKRRENLNIGIDHSQVEVQLLVLEKDLKYWEENRTYDMLEQAVRLHFQCARIHPFYDGNGRWARMLSNIWLKRHDQPIVAWPDEMDDTTSVIRKEYLDTIWEADQGGFKPLVDLHTRYFPK